MPPKHETLYLPEEAQGETEEHRAKIRGGETADHRKTEHRPEGGTSEETAAFGTEKEELPENGALEMQRKEKRTSFKKHERHENTSERVIAEVGVGSEPFFVNADRKIQNDERYVGIDVPGSSMERPWLGKKTAQENFKEIRESEEVQKKVRGKMDLLVASGEHLPFADGNVDEVVFKNVFSAPGVYMAGGENKARQSKQGFINEAARVLKKGGRITIIEQSGTTEIATPFIDALSYDERFKPAFSWYASDIGDIDYFYPKARDRQRAVKSLEKSVAPYVGHLPEGQPWYPLHWFVRVFERNERKTKSEGAGKDSLSERTVQNQ